MQSVWAYMELLGDALLIAFGAVMVFIFGSISITGGYMAIESNPYILYTELGMGFFILLIGINRFLNDIRGIK